MQAPRERRAASSPDAGRTRRALEGRRILVTGAAGSLGREIARACARHEPGALWLLDRAEGGLVELLRDLDDGARARPVLGDLCDRALLASLFAEGIDLVFHAAAVKHVPFLESQPLEAVRVNAIGTHRLLRAAREGGAARFVLLSTDKAVEPCSVLGATKRAAELAVLAAEPAPLAGVAVRFGNVLGSRGSAVPLFDAQIAAGGPLTLTDPEATRYWITPERAVSLVLAASWLGEPGSVLVPELGEPGRVLDLARARMAEAGREVPIQVVGLRPGERRHERLAAADETLEPSGAAGVQRVKSLPVDGRALEAAIGRLDACVSRRDPAGVRAALQALVPLWTPTSGTPGG